MGGFGCVEVSKERERGEKKMEKMGEGKIGRREFEGSWRDVVFG